MLWRSFFYDRYIGRVNDHKGEGKIGNGNGERLNVLKKWEKLEEGEEG